MTAFDLMIWGGAALTTAGLMAILWCILTVARARRGALPDDQMRARMKTVIAVNMAALGASMIGLLCVVAGIMLGR
ncbi:hypothetical protein [Paracoccus jiaweipingae]|uniref:hypothetical protein n=1 Tax=unclassified Paracoccus (in: a-proteobacteria) TaxID=2688777 RepID=UPI0037922A66